MTSTQLRYGTLSLAMLLGTSVATAPVLSAAGTRLPRLVRANPMDEFRGWLMPLVDTLIDEDDALDPFMEGSYWEADGAGWNVAKHVFTPDGGDGPYAPVAALYRLGGERNTTIADLAVEHELQLLRDLAEKAAIGSAAAATKAVLNNWNPASGTPQDLVIALKQTLAAEASATVAALFEDPDLFFAAVTGMPVLIEGAEHYTGPFITRVVAKKTIATLAAAVSLAVIVAPEKVEEAIAGTGLDYSLTVLGSQVAKYDMLLADATSSPAYDLLGVAVINLIQEGAWNQSTGHYESAGGGIYIWELPQLLGSLGQAYRVPALTPSQHALRELFKERVDSTFDYLETHGYWQDLHLNGQSLGAYEPWYGGKLNPYLSSIYLFLDASVEWYAGLRRAANAADRALADLHQQRIIKMLRFNRLLMVNPAHGVMDHDVLIASDLHVESRSSAWPVGCMGCNFWVILDFLRMDQILS
ncbi:MAG: hypothetical protein HYV63_13865 [Candidatus Schekmanbacteria bacterium]|nr:hypothetical protein [Candidatus Schekmanbacteria bacterium]